MNIPVRIGMDTSKSVFQLHGVDENEVVVVRRQFRRAEMIRYFERLPPVLVAIESCGSSHHWARLLQSFGHEVKLIPPQYVKAYVKRGKNDAADAEALCEAVTRPEHAVRTGEVEGTASGLHVDDRAGTPGQREVAALQCFQELCG